MEKIKIKIKVQTIKMANQNLGGSSLIPFEQIVNTTRTSFALIQSLKENSWVKVK